jgi:hypothetical protein
VGLLDPHGRNAGDDDVDCIELEIKQIEYKNARQMLHLPGFFFIGTGATCSHQFDNRYIQREQIQRINANIMQLPNSFIDQAGYKQRS